MKVFYFGCQRGRAGHYWHFFPSIPWKQHYEMEPLGVIDGKYAPRVGPDRRARPDLMETRPEAPQGQAALVYEKGWTVLAYWDRSQDTRGASNSAFAAEGEHSFEELLADAKEQWPWVFERQKFTVVAYVEPTV